jgi:uncharacterized protein DUF2380
MILRLAFYIVITFAFLAIIYSQADAQTVAVFDFEFIDTSLEGAIRGLRPDEQERLTRLSDQLRQLLRNSGRFSLLDITPIAREAQASNLHDLVVLIGDVLAYHLRTLEAITANAAMPLVTGAQRILSATVNTVRP